MKKNNIISDWLDQYSDSEIDKLVEKNLAITEARRLSMDQKEKSKNLTKEMNKQPLEISKCNNNTKNSK